MTKSGFIALIGRPNVGKSTLLNQLLGEKIAITSSKPQTTRNRIQGVYTEGDTQMVFIDTPGIHKPVHKLGEYMVETAQQTMGGVDLVLLLVEPGQPRQGDIDIVRRAGKQGVPIVLVLNKMDSISKSELIVSLQAFQEIYDFAEVVPVSAKTGENKKELLTIVQQYLPEGPFFFPEDMLTDQPERQLVAEMIREKALQLLQKEIPHGIAVMIDSFKEREEKALIDIDATIVCEKSSHKPIIIGKGGRTLKEIGTRAREDVQKLLDIPVNLQLWVKVKERWRDSEFLMRNFGFDRKEL